MQLTEKRNILRYRPGLKQFKKCYRAKKINIDNNMNI